MTTSTKDNPAGYPSTHHRLWSQHELKAMIRDHLRTHPRPVPSGDGKAPAIEVEVFWGMFVVRVESIEGLVVAPAEVLGLVAVACLVCGLLFVF
jgi:hypothetical protein